MKRPIYLTLASAMAFFAVMSLMLALSSFTYAIEGPNLNCKGEHVISINDEVVFLFPDSLVHGRDFGVSLQLRRMANSYIVASDTLPSDSITIGCADVGKILNIEVIATQDGMSSACMVQVAVQNKLPTNVFSTLPDLELSCNEFKNLNGNYSSLGTYVDDEMEVESHNIGETEFRDGLVGRVCNNLTIRETVKDSTKCGFGKFIRVFTVTSSVDTITLEQVINIYNDDPFDIDDITLTTDTTVMGCFKGFLPADLGGKPQFNLLNKCAMVVANKSDMVFDDPTSGCPFVMRTWKIMDMCTYTPDMENGYWEIVQNIYIMDTIAPTFANFCKDTTIINVDGSCTIPVTLSANAKDNCTDDADLVYHYSVTKGQELIIEGNTSTFSLNFKEGLYDVLWTVDDRCGNVSQCTYKLRTKEGKKPTPVLVPGIVANLPQACDVKIAAVLFNKASYDNCTPKDQLKFSFSEDIEDDTLTFNCSQLGINTVTVFVTDLSGNQNSVSVTIEIQDLQAYCPANVPLNISGQIMTAEEMFVPEVEVKIEGAEQSKTVKTDEYGRFDIGNLVKYSDYELSASKEGDFKAGINVLDLLAIQKHLLGVNRLPNGFRMIAADVDGSEKIDLRDLTELRKIILGIKSPDQGTHSWRFIPNTTKNASTQPWPINDMAFYENLENNIFLDFKAIKIGDVDGSISKSLKGRDINLLVMAVEDKAFKAGDIVEIPLTIADISRFKGLQMQFIFYSFFLKFMDCDIDKDAYAQTGNQLNLMIFDQKGFSKLQDGALHHVRFRAIKDGKLSSALALTEEQMEAILVDESDKDYAIHFNIQQSTGNVLDVKQNAPNPFSDHTIVNFEVGSDLPVEITIYDQSGELLFNDYKNYLKGKHQIYLDDTQLKGATGVMFMHVETAEISEIRKLLRLK